MWTSKPVLLSCIAFASMYCMGCAVNGPKRGCSGGPSTSMAAESGCHVSYRQYLQQTTTGQGSLKRTLVGPRMQCSTTSLEFMVAHVRLSGSPQTSPQPKPLLHLTHSGPNVVPFSSDPPSSCGLRYILPKKGATSIKDYKILPKKGNYIQAFG